MAKLHVLALLGMLCLTAAADIETQTKKVSIFKCL